MDAGIYGIPVGVRQPIIVFTIFGVLLSNFGAGGFLSIDPPWFTPRQQNPRCFSTLIGMVVGLRRTCRGNRHGDNSGMKRGAINPIRPPAVKRCDGPEIMPPVMRAAAFIMAEIVGVPYGCDACRDCACAVVFARRLWWCICEQ
jgi:TRAP-type uncharacterized transport system fused permease subunit